MTEDEGGESRPTNRWRGLVGATLVAGALGLVGRRPALLLASAVGVVLLAYARTTAAPPATVAVAHTVSEADPAAGERVAVTVRLTNTGERPLFGLRIADGVPPGWTVVEGAPTHGTALWPGATTTFGYTVEVGAGARGLDPATVLLRDPVGVVEREVTVADDDGFEPTPVTAADDEPALPTAITRLLGRKAVDASGEGVAFRSVREYRRGDPPSRIDWRRRARTGALATVEYRAERRLTVVLVVDARRAAALAPEPTAPTAIQRSCSAVERLYATVTDAGHRVGVATLGPARMWIPPGRGDAHRRRVHEQLPDAVSATPDDGDADDGAWLRQRVPERATVVLCTPACDDAVADLARRLEASGRPTAVVSPDPTAADTAGRRLARLERRQRLQRLRAGGVPVLDWEPGFELPTALARAGWLS